MKQLAGFVNQRLASFLFWYQLTTHTTTGVALAELLLGRRPQSRLDSLKPSLADNVHKKYIES